MIVMSITIAVFLGAIAFVKYRQIQTAMAAGAAWQPPPEAVTTIVAEQDQWSATLSAIGTVVAVHGVTVSADLPGIVERIAFDSGRAVRAGDVLVELDTSQEEAQLQAAKAERDLASLNFERIRGLREKGVTSQAEYDQFAARLKQAGAHVGEIEAAIGRKTIRAPFTGTLGIRQVDLGQYLNGGDPVVPLQSLDPIFVDFSVPQQQVGDLAVGREVRVQAEGMADVAFKGSITAINSIVDSATRNIRAQATLPNVDGRLRPGMFVEVLVVLGAGDVVVALPASAISYAPYGDSVFIVENIEGPNGQTYLGVRQQFVKLGPGRGDQVAVLSGVEPGAEVVTSGVFKLRSGAAVLVNNQIQPANSPTPEPEDS
jgi:membrane fusion protein (multidrug efflux system)